VTQAEGKGRTTPAWKMALVERAGSAFLSLLWRTLRYEVVGDEVLRGFRERGEPVILAFWHSRILPLAHLHRNEGIVVLVSQHRDGETIARIIHRNGYLTARGSSTRGGARGLRELIRAARSGRDLAITPDGPKGPPRRVKLGTVVAAQVTGLPILPLAGGGEAVWRVGSWDRFVIPRPFARIRVRYGEPIRVPRDADPALLEELAARLDRELNRITDEVDGACPDPVRPSDAWSAPQGDGPGWEDRDDPGDLP
jgi:lysophospholipid acyltransferase (LPLAT)-like uncharacterized protein